jgi:hypothetical protein
LFIEAFGQDVFDHGVIDFRGIGSPLASSLKPGGSIFFSSINIPKQAL